MSENWLGATAADLGRSIADGSIDPVTLTDLYLDAIEAHPRSAEIYSCVTPDRARAGARAASDRARLGLRIGPLDGVPISWKDLFDSAGTTTEAGTALLAGRVPDSDAAVLANATAGGAVCLGKTHMSELAFSGLGLNPVTATPPNINDPEGVPGGSSSGAAASVAHGLAAVGIGSDTGGSVRIPSAWNDLVGLKTTSGRVSLGGVVPLCTSFDTVGPLCRSVEDAALTLALLEGRPAVDLRNAGISGARFAVLETVALDDVRDAPQQGFDQALQALTRAGATIERIARPEVAAAMDLTATLYPTEAYATWRDEIEAAPEKMYVEILNRFRGGANVSGPDYVAAWQKLRVLRRTYLEATAGFDAVLVPTSPILPPDRARLLSDQDYYVTENLLALRNTRIGNLMDLSVLTLPTGIASTGISLMCRPYAEERLLRLGHGAELALAKKPQ